MIRINVFVSVNDTNRAKVLTATKELTANSVTESGCIAYDVFESATRPNIFIICETWVNAEALANHEKGEVFVKNIEVLKNFSELKLEKFDF